MKTPTWTDWTNLLLQLIPYHMQETNFITQLILDIKLNHYFLSFWACRGMSDHTHCKQPTNICCFHGPLVTFKNSASYLKLLVRYSSLKNLAFWLVKRFLDHNSRTRYFSQTFCFCRKLKYHKQKSMYIYTHTHSHTQVDKIFLHPKKLIFGTFWALQFHGNFFARVCYFSYFAMSIKLYHKA